MNQGITEISLSFSVFDPLSTLVRICEDPLLLSIDRLLLQPQRWTKLNKPYCTKGYSLVDSVVDSSALPYGLQESHLLSAGPSGFTYIFVSCLNAFAGWLRTKYSYYVNANWINLISREYLSILHLTDSLALRLSVFYCGPYADGIRSCQSTTFSFSRNYVFLEIDLWLSSRSVYYSTFSKKSIHFFLTRGNN